MPRVTALLVVFAIAAVALAGDVTEGETQDNAPPVAPEGLPLTLSREELLRLPVRELRRIMMERRVVCPDCKQKGARGCGEFKAVTLSHCCVFSRCRGHG